MSGTKKGFFQVVGLALMLATQSSVYALAVSDVQLNSHLNQPLDADIMLLSVTPEEIENLKMKIIRSSNEGSDVYRWPNLSVEILTNKQGKHYLHVRSEKPVTEPVVSFTLELDWSHGQLKREYVLLINPKIG